MKLRLIVLLAGILPVVNATAQVDTLDIRDFYLDFAAPSISAFSILDIEPATITRPGNVKEFALGVSNFVNIKGELKAGLAMEWAPLYSLNRKSGNWENRTNHLKKFEFKNFTFSAATTTDSTNVKLGWAWRFAPIDQTNPLNDKVWRDSLANYFLNLVDERQTRSRSLDGDKKTFNTMLVNRLESYQIELEVVIELMTVLDAENTHRLGSLKKRYDTMGFYDRRSISDDLLKELKIAFIDQGLIEAYTAHEKELFDFCLQFTDLFYRHHSFPSFSSAYKTHILEMKEAYKKANWNKWALQLSLGSLANSSDATVSNFKNQYMVGAFTTGFPLLGKNWFPGTRFNRFMRDHSQLLVQVQAQRHFSMDTMNVNSLFAGGRILLGDLNKRFSVEGAYIMQDNGLNINQSGFRYSVGAEFRIAEGYWFELAVGGQNFVDKTGVNILPRFAFRHALGSENRFFKK